MQTISCKVHKHRDYKYPSIQIINVLVDKYVENIKHYYESDIDNTIYPDLYDYFLEFPETRNRSCNLDICRFVQWFEEEMNLASMIVMDFNEVASSALTILDKVEIVLLIMKARFRVSRREMIDIMNAAMDICEMTKSITGNYSISNNEYYQEFLKYNLNLAYKIIKNKKENYSIDIDRVKLLHDYPFAKAEAKQIGDIIVSKYGYKLTKENVAYLGIYILIFSEA
ncbi:hypothetical protein [Breznakia pachnodae]|uniref:PRD domain-containing protein n=1 Tax=Breznakia pachnodae TaxID=265178 RepID=A0ABU0E8F2_9FIRM|nr:hypothetical protein [Breznakia pachnodae]MDQ0363179.1 hypothetical protein [Breznakia pachnodae]